MNMRSPLPTFFLLCQGKFGLVGKKFLKQFIRRTGWPPQRRLSSASASVLILGDSTAVGTGASCPERTIAGLLAAAYPGCSIQVIAKNGLLVHQVLHLALRQLRGRYDLILVLVGANDVLRRTPPELLARRMITLVRYLCRFADRIMLVGQGNLGTAPLFPSWYARRLDERSRRWHAILGMIGRSFHIPVVDFYYEPRKDPWHLQPTRYWSIDGFHPSDEGYAQWFEVIRARLRFLHWEPQ